MRGGILLLILLVGWKGASSLSLLRSKNEHLRSFSDKDPGVPAFKEQPPHAGCHFRPTHPSGTKAQKLRNKRFFEGWYYRVTIPNTNASFAFIASIEDPFPRGQKNSLPLACLQIMGPNDEYLVQSDPDDTKFWAWKSQQALGCTFESKGGTNNAETTTAVPPEYFEATVESGFQVLPTRLQGKLRGHDGSYGGNLQRGTCSGVPGDCDFDFQVQPLAGWGDDKEQISTAGWLASYPIFEPHWQVTMADGRASGMIRWKNSTYQFENAPFYAEKNWGGAFPIKWYWCQCNSFTAAGSNANLATTAEDIPLLSVTAGGGIRKLPLGKTESLGMVSVHYNGTFYEATPWLGDMEWKISPWGYWKMVGNCTQGDIPFFVELEAITSVPGVKLRAPTMSEGMVYFCRDSFYANVTLSLWELDENWNKGKKIVDRCNSLQGAVEVGGGPWWDVWEDASRMKRPLKFLVRLPYRWKNLMKRIQRR